MRDVDVLHKRNQLNAACSKAIEEATGPKSMKKKLEELAAKLTDEEKAQLSVSPEGIQQAIDEQVKITEQLKSRTKSAKADDLAKLESDIEDAEAQTKAREQKGQELMDAMTYIVNQVGRDARLKSMRQRYRNVKGQELLVAGGWPKLAAKMTSVRLNKEEITTPPANAEFDPQKLHLFQETTTKAEQWHELEQYIESVAAALTHKKDAASNQLRLKTKWPGVLTKLNGTTAPGGLQKFGMPVPTEEAEGLEPWMVCVRRNGFLWGPGHWPMPGLGGLAYNAEEDMHCFLVEVADVLAHGISLEDVPAFLDTRTGAELLKNSSFLRWPPQSVLWIPFGTIPVPVFSKSGEDGRKNKDDDFGMLSVLATWSEKAASVPDQVSMAIKTWNWKYLCRKQHESTFKSRYTHWAPILKCESHAALL